VPPTGKVALTFANLNRSSDSERARFPATAFPRYVFLFAWSVSLRDYSLFCATCSGAFALAADIQYLRQGTRCRRQTGDECVIFTGTRETAPDGDCVGGGKVQSASKAGLTIGWSIL
jgi:hypothetical protein